jgi:prepilin-type processing-associated H-X9-DG protein
MWQGWYGSYSSDLYGRGCHFLGAYLDRQSGEDWRESTVYCTEHSGGHSAGYGVNKWLGYDTLLGDHVRMTQSTPMLFCSNFYKPWYGENVWGFDYAPYPNNCFGWSWHPEISPEDYFLSGMDRPHMGSCNFLFFDGHAENQRKLASTGDYLNLWTWRGN